jgi:hypothetical protein
MTKVVHSEWPHRKLQSHIEFLTPYLFFFLIEMCFCVCVCAEMEAMEQAKKAKQEAEAAAAASAASAATTTHSITPDYAAGLIAPATPVRKYPSIIST